MSDVKLKETVSDIFKIADIQIDGTRPWDIKVKNDDFYKMVLTTGSLGLGESYMAGYWECEQIEELIYRILHYRLRDNISINFTTAMQYLKCKIFNEQTKSKAFEVAEKHYNLGNDLFQNMLDKRMVYSCGYWKNTDNLDDAEEAKLDLICRKLYLEPGMKVLDIGCGWGSLAKYAAEKYKVNVVGVTISSEQAKFAEENCKGLPVEIRLQDYRDVTEKFDRVVSVGMFEHVGMKNYDEYMQVADNCLKEDGLFLLHTIGVNDEHAAVDTWINKYIFPNGMTPGLTDITACSNKHFIMEDWHNFGYYYYQTLMAWYDNFKKNWNKIKETGNFDDTFYRMWEYYLMCCAGSFKAKNIQLWQIVFSKAEGTWNYQSIRD